MERGIRAVNSLSDDPSLRWPELLEPLEPARREHVAQMLRRSAQTSQVTRDDVAILVDLALGLIDSRAFVVRTLASWGIGEPAAEVTPTRSSPLVEPEAVIPVSRENAVEAYLSGRITVEEFLRLSR